MGALHCVTGGNTRIYTARTSGEVKSMRHALRLRTTTRGFDATVELQLATSRPCPRSASAEEAGWQQARAVRLRRGHNVEVAAVSRAVASAAYLRVMGASPCASMLQRRAELTRHNSEFHAPVHTAIETRLFRTFASVNRREPVRIWCEYANTRRLRPLRQSHTTSDEISACEYGANV